MEARQQRIASEKRAATLRQASFAALPPVAPEAGVDRIRPRAQSTSPLSDGVNVFGFVRGQFGLGESARLYVRALVDNGYQVALHSVASGAPHGFGDTSLDPYISDTAPHATNLIFVNPDFLRQALAEIGQAKLESRYTIACWFWELERIPDEWMWALELVDEIMVASSFVERAFKRVTDKPILRVPIPISPVADSGIARARFGLAEGKFVFLSTFDFNSWWCRKNPLAAIDAFKKAFPRKRKDVQLLVKSSNGHRHEESLQLLLSRAAGDSRILVKDGVLPRGHMRALQRCADAYLSLHRAEGFGLGLAETMSLGKPAIGTRWSGNLDFMTPGNSCLVDYRLVPVAEGEYPYSEGGQWAEADIEHGSSLMARIVDEPLFAARLGARAAEDIRVLLAPESAADKIMERVRTRASR